MIELFFLFLIPAFALEWEPTEYIYFENIKLSEENPNVDLYVVESGFFMPCIHNGPGMLAGCAFGGPNPKLKDYIYIVEENYVDEFGLSILAHEILHIECGCNWHEDEMSLAIVEAYGAYPYRFIMEHRELFHYIQTIKLEN
jgi:hypothetical protein